MGPKQEFLKKKDPRTYLYVTGNDLTRERWRRQKIIARAKTLTSQKETGFSEQVEGLAFYSSRPISFRRKGREWA